MLVVTGEMAKFTGALTPCHANEIELHAAQWKRVKEMEVIRQRDVIERDYFVVIQWAKRESMSVADDRQG